MFSVRLFIVDYYMSSPISGLDSGYSEFRGAQVKQVPVVRVFGASSSGQKTCLHIHGVFPYIYVPFDGCVDHNKYMYQLASSIDKAINISLGQTNSSTQHVYKICLVSGIPYYGFHTKEHQFFKIYFYNPLIVKKAVELLQNGAILNQMFQPHEAHLPFILQFMIDFNLYGMNLATLRHVKFRRDVDNPGVLENIPEEFLLPERVCKISTCELELDALAADILNRNEITGQLSVNPGLKAIWEDEKQRRREELRVSQPTPQSSQLRPNVGPVKSELFYKDQLQKKLSAMSLMQSGSTVSTPSEDFSDGMKSTPYPAETPEGITLLDASFLQVHIPSLAESQIRTSHQPVCTDDSVVNEEIVLSLTSPSQQAAVPSDDISLLTSQDMRLAEVLQELVEDDSILSSQKSVPELSADEEANEDLNLHDLTQTLEELEEHSPGRPAADPVNDDISEDSDNIWEDTFWSDISENIPQLDGTNDLLEPASRRKTKNKNSTPKSLMRNVLEKTTVMKNKMDSKDDISLEEGHAPCDVEFLCTVGQVSPTPSEVSSDGSVEFLCELDNSANDARSVCESEISDVVGDTVSLQTELFTDNFSSFPLTDASDPAFTLVPDTVSEYDTLGDGNLKTNDSKECESEVEFTVNTETSDKFFKSVLIGDPSFTAHVSLSEKDELLENQTYVVPESWPNTSAASIWLAKESSLVDPDELDEDCDLLRPYEDDVDSVDIDKNLSGKLKEKQESSLNNLISKRKCYNRSFNKYNKIDQSRSEKCQNMSVGVRTKLRSWQTKLNTVANKVHTPSLPQNQGQDKLCETSNKAKQSSQTEVPGKGVPKEPEDILLDMSGELLKNSIDQNDNFMETSRIPKRRNGIVGRLQRNSSDKSVDEEEALLKQFPSADKKPSTVCKGRLKNSDNKGRRTSPICPNDRLSDVPCSSKDVRSALRKRCQQKVKVSDTGTESSLLNINSIDITEKAPILDLQDTKNSKHERSIPQCVNRVLNSKHVRAPRKYTSRRGQNKGASDAAISLSSHCNSLILPDEPRFGASVFKVVGDKTGEYKVSRTDHESTVEIEAGDDQCPPSCNLSDLNKNVKELLKLKINSKRVMHNSLDNTFRESCANTSIQDIKYGEIGKDMESDTMNVISALPKIDVTQDFSPDLVDRSENSGIEIVPNKLLKSDSDNCSNSVNEENLGGKSSPCSFQSVGCKSKHNCSMEKEELKISNPNQLTTCPFVALEESDHNKSEANNDMAGIYCSGGEILKTEKERNVAQSKPYDISRRGSDSIKLSLSSHTVTDIPKMCHLKPCYVKLSRLDVRSESKNDMEIPEETEVTSVKTTMNIAEDSDDNDNLNKKVEKHEVYQIIKLSSTTLQESCKVAQFVDKDELHVFDLQSPDFVKRQLNIPSTKTSKASSRTKRFNPSCVNIKSPKIAVGSPRKTRSLSGLKSVLQVESPRVADTIDTLPENARIVHKYASACIPLDHNDSIRFESERTVCAKEMLTFSEYSCESAPDSNNSSKSYQSMQVLCEPSSIALDLMKSSEALFLNPGYIKEAEEDCNLGDVNIPVVTERTEVDRLSSVRSYERKIVHSAEKYDESKKSSLNCMTDRILHCGGETSDSSLVEARLYQDSKQDITSGPTPDFGCRDSCSPPTETCVPAISLQLKSSASVVQQRRNLNRRASVIISKKSPMPQIKSNQRSRGIRCSEKKSKLVSKDLEDSDDNVPLVKIKYALDNSESIEKLNWKVSGISSVQKCTNVRTYNDPQDRVSSSKLEIHSSQHTKYVRNRSSSQKSVDVGEVFQGSDSTPEKFQKKKRKKPRIQSTKDEKSDAVSTSEQTIKEEELQKTKRKKPRIENKADEKSGVSSSEQNMDVKKLESQKTKGKKTRTENKNEVGKSDPGSSKEQNISIKKSNQKRRELGKENNRQNIVTKRKHFLPLKPAKVMLFRLGNDTDSNSSNGSPDLKQYQKARSKKTAVVNTSAYRKIISLDGTIDSSTSEDSEDLGRASQSQPERPASSSSGELLALPSQILTTPSPKKRKQTTSSPNRTPKKNSYKPLDVKITKSPKQRRAAQDKKSNAIRRKFVAKQTIILNEKKLSAEDLKAFQPFVRIERLDIKSCKLNVIPLHSDIGRKPLRNSQLVKPSLTAKNSGHFKKSRCVTQSVPTGVSIAGSSRVSNRNDPVALSRRSSRRKLPVTNEEQVYNDSIPEVLPSNISDMPCSKEDHSNELPESLSLTCDEEDSFVPSSQVIQDDDMDQGLQFCSIIKHKSVPKRSLFSQKPQLYLGVSKEVKKIHNIDETVGKKTDMGSHNEIIPLPNHKKSLGISRKLLSIAKSTRKLTDVIKPDSVACSTGDIPCNSHDQCKGPHQIVVGGIVSSDNSNYSATHRPIVHDLSGSNYSSLNEDISNNKNIIPESLSGSLKTQIKMNYVYKISDCHAVADGHSHFSVKSAEVMTVDNLKSTNLDTRKSAVDGRKVSIDMFKESSSSQSQLSGFRARRESLRGSELTGTSCEQDNVTRFESSLQRGKRPDPSSQELISQSALRKSVKVRKRLSFTGEQQKSVEIDYGKDKITEMLVINENIKVPCEIKSLETVDSNTISKNLEKIFSQKESVNFLNGEYSSSRSELLKNKVIEQSEENNTELGYQSDDEDDESSSGSESDQMKSFYSPGFNLTQINLSLSSNISDSHHVSQQLEGVKKFPATQNTETDTVDLTPDQIGIVFTPKLRPPTKVEVLDSLSSWGIPEYRYQEPFVSNSADVMKKELGERTLKLISRSVNELETFKCSLDNVNGVIAWRNMRVQEMWEDTQVGSFLESNIPRLENMKAALATEKETIIKPCRAPPTVAEVKLWFKAKQFLRSTNANIEGGTGTKAKPLQIMIPLSPGSMDGDDCITLTPISPACGDVSTDNSDVKITSSQGSVHSVVASEQSSTPPCKSMNNDVGFISQASTNPASELPITSSAEQKSPITPGGKEVVHSTPHQPVNFKTLPSPPCTPIQRQRQRYSSTRRNLLKAKMPTIPETEGESPILPVIHEKQSDPRPANYSPGLNQTISAHSSPAKSEGSVGESSLHRLLLQSQFRRQLNSPKNLSSSCQIEGTTPDNTFGFKMSYENLQDVRALTEYQFLTLLVMELHIQTRGDLRPDPAYDPVQALFFMVVNDVPDGPVPKQQLGMIVVHDAADPQKDPLRGTGIKCDVVTFVETEKELLNEVASLVRKWDPDILAGYEVEMLSWGYLFERAFILEVNLCPLVSRVPTAKQERRDNDKSDSQQELNLEKVLVGRIVLNIWRLMRHEAALMSYSLENVMYHVLHQRIPLHSFKLLTQWWNHRTRLYRWQTAEHYLLRVQGIVKLLDQLDLIARTSELARLFGIQFYEVLSRGSQFRVESMMLRLAKPLNYVPVSPSVRQRAQMRAPESLPLIMEPQSRFYTDPLIVLDFQSLYPSMIIAYNYCFSTCLGRVEHLGQSAPFEFGCTHLQVPPRRLNKLLEKMNISPCGVAFVQKEVRQGVLPRMLEEILDTRLMVKKSMKEHKNNKVLQRVLHSRQLGLKLIANVTYGYTAANFSGRMPCIEVGDSVVSKGRETLERAIHMVEDTERWGARVVYGDTDSLFVLVPGRSRAQAFKIGSEIAEAVTQDNPKPVKLKLEKVYQPCLLQTKKRYVGYMYESPDQEKPVYDAKGIETVRRDGCPAVAKILEKSLRLLFENRDVSLIKKYVQHQFSKLLQGRINLQDLTFAREYRGISGYRPGACVPALELTRQWLQTDKRAEPRTSERVPYIIVNGPPNLPLIRLVRSPHDLLADYSLRINAQYYISRVIIPPLDRCFSLIGADVETWYSELPRKIMHYLPTSITGGQKKSTISQYFATTNCAACGQQTHSGLCTECQNHPQRTSVILADRLRQWERTFANIVKVCQSCCGHSDSIECTSVDCPVLYRRHQASRDLQQADFVRQLQQQYLQI